MTSRGRDLSGVCCVLVLTLQACGSGDDPAPETPRNQGTASSASRSLEPLAGFDQDGDGLYTYDEFMEAVRLEMSRYDWPDGMVITSDQVLYQPTGSRSMQSDRSEIGVERGILDMWHSCAWITTWQDGFRSGDRELQTESFDQFSASIEAQVNLGMDADSQDFLRGIVESAELGDPTKAQRYIDANCVFLTGYPWTDPDIASPSAPQATPADMLSGRHER